MSYVDLTKLNTTIDGWDSIIVVHDDGDIPGGVALDVTDYTDTLIKVGTLLVQNKTDFTVKPLAVTDGSWASLPDGCEYFGIVKSTILASQPAAAVLRRGTVNAAAAAEYLGAAYPEAAITALSHIDFIYKNEAEAE